MDTQVILTLVKQSLGIRHTQRDSYLLAIIEGVVEELTGGKGLALDGANPEHLIFCVDYSVFRYERPKDGMPRDLQYRLHSLLVNVGGSRNA